jgi:predicted ATPase
LDNLQWIDAASLSILRIALADGDLRNLIFVGFYQSDEVGDDHKVAEWMREIAPQ